MKKATKLLLTLTIVLSCALTQSQFTGSASASSATTSVMRDNLFKYNMKKEVELPATCEVGGISYTLEKIMIYETKSETAQALIKKYDFTGTESQKYFIWTKITFENKSGNTVQFGSKDLNPKWSLYFDQDNYAYPTMPLKNAYSLNNKEALWSWALKPGEKLNSYQAFTYTGNFNDFYIIIKNKGVSGGMSVAVKNK